MVTSGWSALRRSARRGSRLVEQTAKRVQTKVTGDVTHLHREHPYAPEHLANYVEVVRAQHPQVIVALTDAHGAGLREQVSACSEAFPKTRLIFIQLTPSDAPPPAPKGRVRVLRVAEPADLYRQLWKIEPFDVVIDLTHQNQLRGETVWNSIYAVPENGLYVIHHLPVGGDFDASALKARLAENEHRLRAASDGRQLGHSYLIRKVGLHHYKLRDWEISQDEFVERLAPRWGKSLLRLKQKDFVSRARIFVNVEEYRFRLRTDMRVRPRHLREYRDVVCYPRQEVIRRNLAMPISYHHPNREIQNTMGGNPIDLDVDWIERRAASPTETLDGPLFHLISAYPGHFGHFMTEDLGRIWGWQRTKKRYPDAKILVSARAPETQVKEYQSIMLEALGVHPDDVVVVNEPTRVKRLIGASPQFHNRRFVDPDVALVWDRIRDTLAPEPDKSGLRRIFIQRPPGGLRKCLNADEVEKYFIDSDFTMVRPELLSIQEQIQLFADAEVVAGWGGSGLFGSLFARNPGRRIVIGSSEYTATNEFLISSVKGDDYYHFWCQAEVSHPEGGWSREAFFSDFTFDFERDGALLDAALR